MAFQRGSQINPALGMVDYSPIARGGEAMARGKAAGTQAVVSGALGGLDAFMSGLQKAEQNKKAEKEMQGVIKMAEKLSTGFEAIADKLDPRIASSITEMRTAISDPTLPTYTRAAAAQTFLSQSPGLINGGMKLFDMEQESAARQAQAAAKAQEQARAAAINDLANRMAMGQPVSGPYAPEIINEAAVKAAQLQKSSQRTVRSTDAAGRPIQTTYGLGMQPTTSPIQEPPRNLTTDEIRAQETAKVEAGGMAKMGVDFLANLETERKNAKQQAAFAAQVLSAFEDGKVRTGTLAKLIGPARTLFESFTGQDAGASEQQIASKGLAGLGLSQVRNLFQGMGAMSNADREKGEATVANITDPKKSIEFFAEVTKMNDKQLADDEEMAIKLQRENVPASEIRLRLLEARSKRKSIVDAAYKKVFKKDNENKPASIFDEADAIIRGNSR